MEGKTLIALLISILCLSSCNQDPLSFPQELFNPQTTISSQDCGIYLSQVFVSKQASASESPVLHINGIQTAACQELKLKHDPPNLKNQIIIELAGSSKNSSSNPAPRPERNFDISLKLESLNPGKYSIWINNEYAIDFTFP